MMDWEIGDIHSAIKRSLRAAAKKELKKLSKEELVEFILDNVDLLRKEDAVGE